MPDKNIHEGHRKRLRDAVSASVELNSLSDVQVLEYLLSCIIPRKDTNPIAHELLDKFGTLYGVLSASTEALFEVPNMTQTASHLLPHLFDITRRAVQTRTKEKTVLANTKDVVDYFQPLFYGRNSEVCLVACLDVNDRLIQTVKVGEGTGCSTTIDMHKFISLISRAEPASIVIAHNHPAGSLRPSYEDRDFVERLLKVLDSMCIRIFDNIIFTDDGYYSFWEKGLISYTVVESSDMLMYKYASELQTISDRRDIAKMLMDDKPSKTKRNKTK